MKSKAKIAIFSNSFQPVVVATKHYKSKVHIVDFLKIIEPAGKPGSTAASFRFFNS